MSEARDARLKLDAVGQLRVETSLSHRKAAAQQDPGGRNATVWI